MKSRTPQTRLSPGQLPFQGSQFVPTKQMAFGQQSLPPPEKFTVRTQKGVGNSKNYPDFSKKAIAIQTIQWYNHPERM